MGLVFLEQNNAHSVGGYTHHFGGGGRGSTEIWNGTSWTYGSAMNNGEL